jgi:hypothetical protein
MGLTSIYDGRRSEDGESEKERDSFSHPISLRLLMGLTG